MLNWTNRQLTAPRLAALVALCVLDVQRWLDVHTFSHWPLMLDGSGIYLLATCCWVGWIVSTPRPYNGPLLPRTGYRG